MSRLVVFIAGLLLVAESQASDVADRSTLQGFLPKYDASKSSMSAYDKFITPNLASHQSPAEHGASPFTVIDDKPLPHPTAQMQEREEGELATGSNNTILLSAIGVGLLSFFSFLHLCCWMRKGLVVNDRERAGTV